MGWLVIPSFFHINWAQKGPDSLVIFFFSVFLVSWFCFLIGFWSHMSCILMTAGCYYFHMYDFFYIRVLSWDILLATLFLMCLVPYHGDYFSVDVLRAADINAYKRPRPFFIQRLLQMIAICYGFFFFMILVWTKDMPALFLLLFPAQMLLFIDPQKIIEAIEYRRHINAQSPRPKVLYDSHCGFCRSSVEALKVMDLWGKIEYVPSEDLSEMRLQMPQGASYGGFYAFRKLTWMLPMLYPFIGLVYFPGAGIIGPWVYRAVARNRYLLGFGHSCKWEGPRR